MFFLGGLGRYCIYSVFEMSKGLRIGAVDMLGLFLLHFRRAFEIS